MVPKLIYLVAGARPNFMKIAPIVRALDKQPRQFIYQLIHTGQHYDREMSDIFFQELGIPEPDYCFESGGGTHAEQSSKIMLAFEAVCRAKAPDCVIVVGDVNSTLACSIVAKKMHIPVAHVEAGLRSGDMLMPEEINRLVTDSISDWFFCTEPSGVKNLLQEGKSQSRIFNVGQVMVDNLLYQCEKLDNFDKNGFQSEAIKNKYNQYAVVTLHRPSNVDDPETFVEIVSALNTISERLPVIFPLHPRTASNLKKFDIVLDSRIVTTKPLSYMDFLNLWKDASVVLTDSGGLQEETTALGLPCLTLRNNTERPITLDEGTNVLVGSNAAKIIVETERILEGHGKSGKRPQLWDGRAAERIVYHLEHILN